MGGNFSPIGRSAKSYNLATGGTETTVTNYNGTGQIWKVHTFTSNGTLSVVSGVDPFRVLAVAGGGPSGPSCCGYTGGPGGGGGTYESSSQIITPQSVSIVIGAGGSPSGGFSPGNAGGNTSITISGTTITCGGGGQGGSGPDGSGSAGAGTGANGGENGYGGGNGTGPGRNCEGQYAAQGANRTSNITGASITYSQPSNTTANRGGSAGCGGGNGAAGVVVVAYRIG